MPQKLMMSLNNNYSSAQYFAAMNSLQKSATQAPKPSGLQNAMIGRIHNVRPGCGPCGK
jgi:hypothetical protein